MIEEYGHIPDGFHLSDKEVEDLRKSKKELTEYGKQKLRELMDKDLIFKDNGKETFRLSSDFALGKKVPETKLEIKMTEPIHAKVSDEDFQKIVEAFDNQEPYPDSMFDEAERREAERKALDALDKLYEENGDRKSTRLNSSHIPLSRMPSSA